MDEQNTNPEADVTTQDPMGGVGEAPVTPEEGVENTEADVTTDTPEEGEQPSEESSL